MDAWRWSGGAVLFIFLVGISARYIAINRIAVNPFLIVAEAIADLFWTFFPVFVVLLVLALVGKLGHIADRTDLILSASVLFAEGWWRTRSRLRGDASALEFLGFIGAVLTVVLASLLLLVEAGQITQLAPVTASALFTTLHFSLLGASLLYGYVVRIRIAARQPRFGLDDNRPL